jgi:hypothetical protein
MVEMSRYSQTKGRANREHIDLNQRACPRPYL